MRFHLLETTKAYAAYRLSRRKKPERWRDKHLAHYLALAEKAAPELTGPHQAEWLTRLETEHENLRAALDWALEEGSQEPGAGSQGHSSVIARSPDDVGTTRQPLPGQSEYPPPKPPPQGGRTIGVESALRLAVALGRFWFVHGWFSEGRDFLALAIRKNPDRTSNEHGHALRWAGILASWQGEYEEARRMSDESLPVFRATGDKKGESAALHSLGNVAHEQGDDAEAKRLYQESLALRREVGDKWGIALSLGNLGLVAYEQGDFKEAKRLYQESFAIQRELGNKQGIAYSLNNLGDLAFEQGEYEEAKRLIRESLALFRELGDKRGIAYSLEEFGYLAASEAKAGRAAKLYGATAALREAIHAPLPPSERARHEKAVEAAKAALGQDAFNRAYAEGRAMPLAAAIEMALKES